jgi:hypothetical protein
MASFLDRSLERLRRGVVVEILGLVLRLNGRSRSIERRLADLAPCGDQIHVESAANALGNKKNNTIVDENDETRASHTNVVVNIAARPFTPLLNYVRCACRCY